MKQLFRSISLSFIALLFTIAIHAQQFKWAHGGGSVYDFSSAGSSSWEQTKFMCTDPNGNVYVLSNVGNDPIVADTFHGTPYGGTRNVLITSYDCSGQMRWAKLLASSGGDCLPFGIVTDSLGHVYIAGSFDGGGSVFHIGNDTTISPPASNYLMKAVIQLDTNGHFKWIRYVGANTFPSAIAMGSIEDPIALDGSNNIHFFCYIQGTGIPFEPSYSSVFGVYDIVYNTGGVFLNATRLDLDSQWYLHGAIIDPESGKLYTYGEINTLFGTDTFFAAAFTPSRSLIWQYFAGHGNDNAFSGVVFDKTKHLRFSGGTQSSTFSFNGDSVSRSHLGGNMSIVLSVDTNGHVIWFRKLESTISVKYLTSITLLPNNKVAALGTFAGEVLDDGGISFVTPAGMGWLPYFVLVDSAGNLQTMQRLSGDGFNNEGTAIASDKVGNIFLGGVVVDSIWAGTPTIPAYHSIGGNTDFFVMKYGVDCSCTSSPIAAYTDTGTHTIGFTYTGTTTGIDSVIWTFGDGNTGTGTTPLHTYTASGTYHACATVYTDCGSDIHCSDVTVTICTLPTASFSDTGTHIFSFTYTGTTTGLDSVVWNYGDGNTGTGIAPLHTYTATGTYTVCVTAYTACGSDSACHTVVVSTTGIGGFSLSNVQVYPNPVSEELHIVGVPVNTGYRLLNVTGVAILQGTLAQGRNTLSVKNFAPGIYILEMMGADGVRDRVRVVKD